MKNYYAMLVASTMLAFSTFSYAADETAEAKDKVEYKDNGGYTATSNEKEVTKDGTYHSSDSKVDVDVNSKGLVTKTVKDTDVTDPKGLMNKKTDKSTTKIQEKERGGYKQTTTTRHTDADGTNVVFTTTTDVDVDSKGNVTSVAKTEKTVDPKGLMNKKTSTSMTKTVNGKVVEQKENN